MSQIMKQVVVISRHWHSPQISVTLTDEHIGIECPLDDFLKGLVEELNHPLKTMTKARLLEDIMSCKDIALNKIKQASTHAV